jgi:hypothetical protein
VGFIYDLPLWIVGLALVLVMCGLAALGLRLARSRVLPRLQIAEEDAHFSSTVVHSIMVFYALAVAMIAITVWETYDAAGKIVSSEASALATLYRDVSAYPEPMRAQLQGTLREYTDSVIKEAWPEQHKGRVPEGGVERIDRFQETLTAFEPGSDGQAALHVETLRAFNHMVEARRMRLDAVQTALPALLWTVIFLGAALGNRRLVFLQGARPAPAHVPGRSVDGFLCAGDLRRLRVRPPVPRGHGHQVRALPAGLRATDEALTCAWAAQL